MLSRRNTENCIHSKPVRVIVYSCDRDAKELKASFLKPSKRAISLVTAPFRQRVDETENIRKYKADHSSGMKSCFTSERNHRDTNIGRTGPENGHLTPQQTFMLAKFAQK